MSTTGGPGHSPVPGPTGSETCALKSNNFYSRAPRTVRVGAHEVSFRWTDTTRARTCVLTHVHTYTRTHVHTYTRTHAHTHTHWVQTTHAHTHTRTHTRTHTHTSAHTRMHTDTHRHTQTHTVFMHQMPSLIHKNSGRRRLGSV